MFPQDETQIHTFNPLDSLVSIFDQPIDLFHKSMIIIGFIFRTKDRERGQVMNKRSIRISVLKCSLICWITRYTQFDLSRSNDVVRTEAPD